ncbi:WD40 repeat-like protein [Zalerion maritima]|uniref:WD40 repeat-like protein n=1 Tax=Zalerion maritima TaxID=339359 RepID=A0AAD5RRN5_9PEZI|nr:WD40 repeat-like protein [Zalerion maritima]
MCSEFMRRVKPYGYDLPEPYLPTTLPWMLVFTGPVHALTYSATPGTYILTGSSDRSIRLYNPSTTVPVSATPTSSYIRHNDPAAKHSSQATSGGIPQGRLIATYTSHAYSVLSLTVSSDNAHFASSGSDRAILLWDVAASAGTSSPIRRIGGAHGHSGRINAVAFAGENDSLLISGGFDTSVRIWDLKSNSARPVMVLDEARDAVQALAVRGCEILSGSVDGKVRSYDVRTGKVTADLVGSPITGLDLTRDGRSVLVSSLGEGVRLFDRADGTCLKTYKGKGRRNAEFRLQPILGGRERWVLGGDEADWGNGGVEGEGEGGGADAKIWVWDLLSGDVARTLRVPWGLREAKGGKKVLGSDGREKKDRAHVATCLAWKEGGWGDTFAVGGTSGVVTVFGRAMKE